MHSPLFPYDKAMYDLIHNLYDNLVFSTPEEHFKRNAKLHKGKVVLPLIGIWRLPDFSINEQMVNDSALRKGYLGRTSDTRGIEFPNQRVQVHMLPVTLQYQIDVYATKRDVCDGLTAELLMFLKEHPYINIHVPDMGDRLMEFNLDIEESVSDNTDITSFDETNRVYRLTITVDITEALIFRVDDYSKIDKVLIEFSDNDSVLDSIDYDIDIEGNVIE